MTGKSLLLIPFQFGSDNENIQFLDAEGLLISLYLPPTGSNRTSQWSHKINLVSLSLVPLRHMKTVLISLTSLFMWVRGVKE